MDKVLVSIIVPCYNQAQYLDEALESVFNQTYDNWECIIVNDGSPDNTEEVAKKWLEKDRRFIYLYKENGGLSSARNLGLENANGDYIQFLDSDDYLASDKISKSLNLIQNFSSNNIVVSNFKFFKNDITDELGYGSNLASDLFTFNKILYGWDFKFNIPIHCSFFSAFLFQKFRFPEDLGAKEDWIMWLRFSQEDVTFHFLNETLAFYRQHDGGMTRNKEYMIVNTLQALNYLENVINNNQEYKDYLLYSMGNRLREYDELNTKYDELKNELLSINSSYKIQILKRIKRCLKKIYSYLKVYRLIFLSDRK